MKKLALSLILATVAIACNGLNSKQQSAADKAIDSLEKLNAAVSVGAKLDEYHSLVIAAKADVNSASAVLPAGELRKSLDACILSYEIAELDWKAMGRYATSSALNGYWNIARKNLKVARELAN